MALLALTISGCDDNTGSLGMGMFPESDQLVNGRLSTFEVITESTLAGSLYAKTSIGYLGKFTDPTFGTYKAGFLSQLNCPEGLTFPEPYQAYDANGNKVEPNSPNAVRATGVMTEEGIIKTRLCFWYTSYFGDPQTPCRLSAYQLNRPLDKNTAYYTDINPENYYNPNDLLGRKAYTAVDLAESDSLRNTDTYTPSVQLVLDNEVGNGILKKAHEYGVKLSDHFVEEVFKGVYVNSDYGDGTILYVNDIQLELQYTNYVTDSITGLKLKKKYEKDENGVLKDSISWDRRDFVATKEIIQANHLTNNETKIKELIEDPKWTYLKTPAGIFTKATLPLDDIYTQLKNDTLNAVKLTFTNYNQESDLKYGMSAPSYVLLVREKDQKEFFEKNKLTDEITSFLSQHNATATNQYVFSNLTRLITTCIAEKEAAREQAAKAGTSWDKEAEEKWEKETNWDKVVLIPVLVTYDSSQSMNGTPNIISIQHDLKPGYVRLKGGDPTREGNALKLEVVSTNFSNNK